MNLIIVNNLTPDSACRTFFSNDIHFASFSNAVLFDGKQLIPPERFVRFEFDTSFIINDTKSVEDKKRRRDIVVKTDVNGIYCLFGIEHQSTIDVEMVIRCGNYEGLHRRIKMNRNNFIYAAIITGSLDLIKDLPEGDEIDMYEGMERMAERFRSEGRTEGRKEGKLEEKKNTLKEQLIIKLGAVSSRLEEQLTNASLSTVIAVFENIIACTMELLNIERKKAIIINFILITVLSLPCALGFNVLSHIQPLGAGSTILDLEDYLLVSYCCH